MIILVLLLAICLFFSAQIMAEILILVSHAKPLEPGPWDLLLAARKRRSPKIFIMREPGLETLVISNALGLYAFVSQTLWDQWTPPERSAFVLWCASTRLISTNLGRMIWGFNHAISDRNASLESDEKLAIVGALEKAAVDRAKIRSGFFTTFLSGLSLIGPSLLHEWPPVSERLKELTFHLSKLEKAR